jgi:hypothetical protein
MLKAAKVEATLSEVCERGARACGKRRRRAPVPARWEVGAGPRFAPTPEGAAARNSSLSTMGRAGSASFSRHKRCARYSYSVLVPVTPERLRSL